MRHIIILQVPLPTLHIEPLRHAHLEPSQHRTHHRAHLLLRDRAPRAILRASGEGEEDGAIVREVVLGDRLASGEGVGGLQEEAVGPERVGEGVEVPGVALEKGEVYGDLGVFRDEAERVS